MRCPKCQYISFDSLERCRNCGYEFALATDDGPQADLSLRSEDVVGPPADLVLRPGNESVERGESPVGRGGGEVMPASAGELPLFDVAPPPRASELRGPAQPSPTPRPPLAVRRPAPDTPRRPTPVPPPVDSSDLLAFPSESDGGAKSAQRRSATSGPDAYHQTGSTAGEPAPWPRRVIAGLVDASIMGAIDVAVLYFTVRLTGLSLEQADRLPLLPLVGFLVLLNGGYLVSFTAASGRTIGKMVTGLRVVGDRSLRVAFGQAVVRSAAVAVSVLPFGAGCFLALLDPDRRALHDRLAGTRVVRA
jgi:uncharacterized RDD family membrane protein YckC